MMILSLYWHVQSAFLTQCNPSQYNPAEQLGHWDVSRPSKQGTTCGFRTGAFVLWRFVSGVVGTVKGKDCIKRKRERETKRERERERHSWLYRYRETEREKDRERETNFHVNFPFTAERQTEKVTERNRNRQKQGEKVWLEFHHIRWFYTDHIQGSVWGSPAAPCSPDNRWGQTGPGYYRWVPPTGYRWRSDRSGRSPPLPQSGTGSSGVGDRSGTILWPCWWVQCHLWHQGCCGPHLPSCHTECRIPL